MTNPRVPRWGDPDVTYNKIWTWPTQAEVAAAKAADAAAKFAVKPKHERKTMKHQRWFPKRIADQLLWLENFRSKVAAYVLLLGLNQARVDAVIANTRFTIYVLGQWLTEARAFGPTATNAVDLLLNGSGTTAVVLPDFTAPALPTGVVASLPGVYTQIFNLVTDIKKSPAYTETIGADLLIVGAAEATQYLVPEITLKLLAGSPNESVEIHFVKHSHTGIYMESRRGTTDWELLAVTTYSPYIDSRPLLVAGKPEVREVRARFWDKGIANGDWTDVAKITVAP